MCLCIGVCMCKRPSLEWFEVGRLMGSLSIPALMSESSPINVQLIYSRRFNRPAFKCTDPTKVCTNLHTELINVTCANSVNDPWACGHLWRCMTETFLKCHRILYQTQSDDFIFVWIHSKRALNFLMLSNWGQQTPRGPKDGAMFYRKKCK